MLNKGCIGGTFVSNIFINTMRIGVLGAGHLGKIHIKILKDIESYNLIGFYDPDEAMAAKVEKEFGVKSFSSPEVLISAVDVIDIVTPTLSHYDCFVNAAKESKHIFIEKPLANTTEEALNLIKLTSEANIQVMVGHVERFNPAFIAAAGSINNPMFIESHRLAQFNPRGTDVPVVLDLMIHDLDIILSTTRSNVKKISASGVAVVSDTPDIANARLEFDNGCVANLTASRISLKNMRKTRFFQRDAYISIDFLEKKSEIVRMKDVVGEPDPLSIIMETGTGLKEILIDKPNIAPNNAIREELLSFQKAILENTNPVVTIDDGYNALNIAHQILEKMRFTTSEV